VTLVLYVDVSLGELAIIIAASAAGYALEGLVAGIHLRRAAQPVAAWLAGERSDEATSRAWSTAASLPLGLLRRRSLYAIGALAVAAADLVVAALLDLPAYQAALLFPASYLLYLYAAELRYIGLDIAMRPVLETIGEHLPAATPPSVCARVDAPPAAGDGADGELGTAVVVAGLVTANTRDLDKIGLASVVAIGVTAVISVWLSLVLADTVSAPIADLRDATLSVGAGDLSVRVPVVSTDETGELAASFNAMVAGLRRTRTPARGLRRVRRPGADRTRPDRGNRPAGRGRRRLAPVPRRPRVHRVRRAGRGA
jgi:HAMP domain-containing protein